MSAVVACPGCARKIPIEPEEYGRKIICAVCETEFRVSQQQAPPPQPAPWHVTRDGKKRHGPYSGVQLGDMVREGRLLPTDLLWKAGMAKWVKAGSVRGLFGQTVDESVVAIPDGQSPAARPHDKARRVYCRDCGESISERAEICPRCGVRQFDTPRRGKDEGDEGPGGLPARPASDTLSVLGVVFGATSLGLLACSCLIPLFLIGAVPLNLAGLALSMCSGSRQRDVGLLLAGMPWVLGAVLIVAAIAAKLASPER